MGWESPEGRWLRHVCPSVRLSLFVSAYTRAVPLNVFPWFLILAIFAQICPGTLISVTIAAQYRPKYVYIVDSSMKYFVVHQQCRGNPLLRLRDNAEQFCIVDSYMYVINDTNGTYCCVSTPWMVTWTRDNITFHVHCLYDIQNYYFSCCFLWVWNLVSFTEGGT
jgi:hypothetical protein